MESITLAVAILISVQYFFRLEADYLFRVAEKQFQEEQKSPQLPILEYDFIIGKGVMRRRRFSK